MADDSCKKSSKKAGPLTVKVGRAVAKIYRDTSRGNIRYTVSYYDSTRRRRREVYTDLETAKIAANLVVAKLQNGQVDVLELTNQDRSNYLHAVGLLGPFDTRIDVAVSEYVDARKALGTSGSVLEAARFYHLVIDDDEQREWLAPTWEKISESLTCANQNSP